MFRAGCSDAGAERSHVVESAKPGKPPPAEPPKGGRRVPRRGGHDPPLDAKPARGKQLFPRKTSRGTRPARPAGGGTNAFCFLSLVAPAPPRLPELSVPRLRAGEILCVTSIQSSRAARAETCNIRQYNPRALLEIKNNRFPLNKRPVSTSPLLLFFCRRFRALSRSAK